MTARTSSSPIQRQPPSVLSDLDRQLALKQETFVDAAAGKADWKLQEQLRQELGAIRAQRRVAEAGVIEIAALTETAVAEMAQTGLFAQVIVDGLRGKVDDEVIADICGVRAAALEGIQLTHAAGTGIVFKRVHEFRAPASKVGTGDVVFAVLTGRLQTNLLKG